MIHFNRKESNIFNSFKKKVRRLVYGEANSDLLNNNVRRMLITSLFCLVGIFFTGLLGIVALIKGDWLLSFILLFISCLYFFAVLFIRWATNYQLAGKLFIYPLYALMLYLVYTGGVSGTGHVWIFCVPAVSLFLQGLRRGVKELCVFSLLLGVILFFADDFRGGHDYDDVIASRIMYSFLVVVALSTIYEYSMSHYNKMLRESSYLLEKKAITDELTKLLNRYGMYEKLETSVSGRRHILLMDIDHFKQINDIYGHDAGDVYLEKVAQVLTSTIGPEGVVARWGGEEFLVLLSTSSIDEAKHWARRVCSDVCKLNVPHKRDLLQASISIGISKLEPDDMVHDSISYADAALYKAKREGRNRYVVATGQDESRRPW
ncbi:diguanylate cyclase (GGDEF)-like protein [Marinomonas balearica]|uniref:diguanylate cyclase n=1 Tax=Marinomonas balearica TaxID=491947 RepID=A0A4R6MLC5_9GAMM|nr:diguanylate cyclase (GGDEF)-like protein [Marinomonas balearica]